MYKVNHGCKAKVKPFLVNNQPLQRSIDCVNESFVFNKYGHIRSDFAILTSTCEGAEFAKMLQQMQNSYQESSSKFDGMTFEEMVTSLRPRWCQLPGEQDRFEQYLIDNALDFYKKLRANEEAVAKEEGLETPPPATIAPES